MPTLFSDNGSVNSKHAQPPAGGRGELVVGVRGGRYSRFQVTGMIKGFWGGALKLSIPGIFLGKKIWQVFFGVA